MNQNRTLLLWEMSGSVFSMIVISQRLTAAVFTDLSFERLLLADTSLKDYASDPVNWGI